MDLYNKIVDNGSHNGNLLVTEYPRRINPIGNVIPFSLKSKDLNGGAAQKTALRIRIDSLPVEDSILILNGIKIYSKNVPGAGQMFATGTTSDCASSIATAINIHPTLSQKYYAIQGTGSSDDEIDIIAKLSGSICNITYTLPTGIVSVYESLTANDSDWGSSKFNYSTQIEIWVNNGARLGYNQSDVPIGSNSELVTILESNFTRSNDYKYDLSSILRPYQLDTDPVQINKANYFGVYKNYELKDFAIKYFELYQASSDNNAKVRYPVGEWRYGWTWPASFDEVTLQSINVDDYIYDGVPYASVIFRCNNVGWPSTGFKINGKYFGLSAAAFGNINDCNTKINGLVNTLNSTLETSNYTWERIDYQTFKGTADNPGDFYNLTQAIAVSDINDNTNTSTYWSATITDVSNDTLGKLLSNSERKWLPRKNNLYDTLSFIYTKTSTQNDTIQLKIKYKLFDGTITDWSDIGYPIVTNGSGVYSCNIDAGNIALYSSSNPELNLGTTEGTEVDMFYLAFFKSNVQLTEARLYEIEEYSSYQDYTELLFMNSFGGFERAWFRNNKSTNDRSPFIFTRTQSSSSNYVTKKSVSINETKRFELVADAQTEREVNWYKELNVSNKIYRRDGEIYYPVIITSTNISNDNTKELYTINLTIEDSYERETYGLS